MRFVAWMVFAGFLLLGQLIWLIQLQGRAIIIRDEWLIGGQIVLGVFVLGIWVLLKSTPVDAIRLAPSVSRAIIFTGVALFQIATVVLLLPGLSDQIVRDRLDGRTWLSGVSPYSVSPRQMIRRATINPRYAPDSVDRIVSNPDLTTSNPPVVEAFDVVAAAIDRLLGPPDPQPAAKSSTRSAWRDSIERTPSPYRAIVFRGLFAACAIAACWVLLRILQTAGASPWWAVLFAWNPLTVLEIGGMGHADIVGVLLLLLCLRASQLGQFRRAAVLLGLAAGVWPLAALIAPFLYRESHERNSFRSGRQTMMIFLLTVAAIYSPVLSYHHAYRPWINLSRIFPADWQSNGSIYLAVNHVFAAEESARLVAVLLVGLSCLLAWQARAGLAEGMYWIMLAALAASPVVHPWHMLWILCVIPLMGQAGFAGLTGIAWAATVAISYLLWRTANWILPTGWMLAEYLPVYIAMMIELMALLRTPPLKRAMLARRVAESAEIPG